MAPKSKRGKGKGEKKKKDEKGDCFNLASTNYSLICSKQHGRYTDVPLLLCVFLWFSSSPCGH
jgi:hypothetical protein